MTVPDRPRLRRRDASTYLLERHGLDVAPATLQTMAVRGGGPAMSYFGRIPLYAKTDLDAWASQKVEAPVFSTAQRMRA